MGVGHLKSGRSRMRDNSLLYAMFRGVNYGGSFFYEIGLEVASDFRSSLPWTWAASFLQAYPSQPFGL